MSAFTVTMLYAITLGIGFGIAYFFNKANLKLWRMLHYLSSSFTNLDSSRSFRRCSPLHGVGWSH